MGINVSLSKIVIIRLPCTAVFCKIRHTGFMVCHELHFPHIGKPEMIVPGAIPKKSLPCMTSPRSQCHDRPAGFPACRIISPLFPIRTVHGHFKCPYPSVSSQGSHMSGLKSFVARWLLNIALRSRFFLLLFGHLLCRIPELLN